MARYQRTDGVMDQYQFAVVCDRQERSMDAGLAGGTAADDRARKGGRAGDGFDFRSPGIVDRQPGVIDQPGKTPQGMCEDGFAGEVDELFGTISTEATAGARCGDDERGARHRQAIRAE